MFNIEVPQNLQYMRDNMERLHGDVLDEIKLFLNSRPTVQFDDLFYFTADHLKFRLDPINVNNVQYIPEDYVVFMLQNHLDKMAGLSKHAVQFSKGLLRRTWETYFINLVMMLAMDFTLALKNAFVYGHFACTRYAIHKSYLWIYTFRYFFNNRHGQFYCKVAEATHESMVSANMKERRWNSLKYKFVRCLLPLLVLFFVCNLQEAPQSLRAMYRAPGPWAKDVINAMSYVASTMSFRSAVINTRKLEMRSLAQLPGARKLPEEWQFEAPKYSKTLEFTEQPKAPEPKAQEPKAPEPKAQKPKAQEPKAQEPKAPTFDTVLDTIFMSKISKLYFFSYYNSTEPSKLSNAVYWNPDNFTTSQDYLGEKFCNSNGECIVQPVKYDDITTNVTTVGLQGQAFPYSLESSKFVTKVFEATVDNVKHVVVADKFTDESVRFCVNKHCKVYG
jgi:hypothetical protein